MADYKVKLKKPNSDDGWLPLTTADQVIVDTESGLRLDEALGGEGIDLLWKNSNLWVDFPAQKINLDLRDYKAIIVKLAGHKFVDSTVFPLASTHIIGVNDELIDHLMAPSWSLYFRRVYAKDDGVYCESGYYFNNWNSPSPWTHADQCAIPMEIYGIKKSKGKKYKVIENAQNYSTDERIVGTWVDGKPIYAKTFIGIYANEQLMVSNVDSYIGCEGTARYVEESIWNPLPLLFQWGAEYRLAPVHADDYIVMNIERSNTYTSAELNLTIKYTKTTD